MTYDPTVEKGMAYLDAIGSFWSDYFNDSSVLSSYFDSFGQEALQRYIGLVNIVESLSRFTVPILQYDRWFGLTLNESDRNTSKANILTFGQGAVLGAQPAGSSFTTGKVFRFGIPFTSDTKSYFDIDTSIRSIAMILDNPVSPNTVMTEGNGFKIDTELGVLEFERNPFNVFEPRDIFDASGNLVDRQVFLWCFNTKIDIEQLKYRFAYAIGQIVESTEKHKELVNAIYDTLVLGPSEAAIRALFCAMVGVQTTKTNGETVEMVEQTPAATHIVTDANAYRFSASATPVVSVGDTVDRFDTLVDSVKLVYGKVAMLAELTAISAGSDLIPIDIDGELSFVNQDFTLSAGSQRFPVGGNFSDVTKFWEEVASREEADGSSLDDYLDTEVNPLEILLDLIQSNTFLVVIDRSAVDDTIPVLIRALLPPEVGYIILERSSIQGTVDLSGVSQEFQQYDCGDPIAENIEIDSLLTNRVIVKAIKTCEA